jgi:hypothetical protein
MQRFVRGHAIERDDATLRRFKRQELQSARPIRAGMALYFLQALRSRD